MKTCKIDKLGRIVIPIQYRKNLGLCENSEINIEYKEERIIITPATEGCKICGAAIVNKTDIPLCRLCVEKVKKIN